MLGRAHFVLVIGWDAADLDTLYVHDPYFLRESYSYASDVDGWRLFLMEPYTAQREKGPLQKRTL